MSWPHFLNFLDQPLLHDKKYLSMGIKGEIKNI